MAFRNKKTSYHILFWVVITLAFVRISSERVMLCYVCTTTFTNTHRLLYLLLQDWTLAVIATRMVLWRFWGDSAWLHSYPECGYCSACRVAGSEVDCPLSGDITNMREGIIYLAQPISPLTAVLLLTLPTVKWRASDWLERFCESRQQIRLKTIYHLGWKDNFPFSSKTLTN